MALRDFVIDSLLIGMSTSLLWHFSNIWRYGQHLIQEPNIVILILETAGLVLILVFGISKYIGDLKKTLKINGRQRAEIRPVVPVSNIISAEVEGKMSNLVKERLS